MFSRRSMMALLAVLALSAQAAESAIAAPKVCAAADVGKAFCINCKTKAKCEADLSPPVPKGTCTVAGEACTVLVGVATCKPFANTACTCAKPAQCDAYDPNSVLVCLSGGITASTNCATTGKTCVNGACVTPATTTSTASPAQLCSSAPDGFVVLKPSCTSAVYCSGFTSLGVTDCPSGNYFDMNEQNCLPIPPVPCAGCGTGACPDKSNCSKWYICDGGTVLSEETCDPASPDFDIGLNECVASGGNCTGNDDCTYVVLTTSAPTTTTPVSTSTTTPVSSSTTTPVSSSTTTPVSTSTTTAVSSSTTTTSRPATCTAANVGHRYPYAGICKKYWSCRLVATGVYAYVESTCLGDLVFNAATGYCDTLANVPSCVLVK